MLHIPLIPSFCLTSQAALIFVVWPHSQSRNHLTSYKNPLPHPPLPRSQSCKQSQAWAQSLEETWASHKAMQREPSVVLCKVTVIAVGQHLKMWVIIKVSFVFFLWSKQQSDGQQNISSCRGNTPRCWGTHGTDFRHPKHSPAVKRNLTVYGLLVLWAIKNQTNNSCFLLLRSIQQLWVCSLLILFGIYITEVQNPHPKPCVRCLNALRTNMCLLTQSTSQQLTMAWCNPSRNLNTSKRITAEEMHPPCPGRQSRSQARFSESWDSPWDHRQLTAHCCLSHAFSWHGTTDSKSPCDGLRL